MSPKNVIKMIIQKYYSAHIGLIWSTLVHSTHFGSIQSTLVQFVHLVLFSQHWSQSVHYGPIRSYQFLLGPHWSTQSYLVHFGPIRSSLFPFCHIFFHSVHFVPFGPFVFTSSIFVHFHTGKNMFRLIVPILNPNIYIYIQLLHFC